MHFHEVFLGSQHEMWSKQHNGKVSLLLDEISMVQETTIRATRQSPLFEEVENE